MKKFMSLAVALVATAMLSSSVFAATDFTASVSFSGGDVTFDASLSSGTSLTWNANDIYKGQSTAQWKAATACIQMTKTITKASGKVYFYSDNTAAAGTSGSVAYVATSSKTAGGGVFTYNGLVKGGSGGGETGFTPMSFKVSTVTIASPMIDPTAASHYGTRYMIDAHDSNFTKDGYCMVANANGYVEDVGAGNNPNVIEGSASVSTGYLYIGAGFVNVMGGDSYGSNHIKFEVVEE